ncbi:MAG: NADH-quinone oxidoreductase subunit H [Lentisphaeria bacterium]|nr:NADH-quinone oxidoreductase subunit H [Lentisphaeria bacterium]
MNSPLFSWLVSVILSLLLAPLLPGIINRVKAFFAGRRGPSPFQLYYDIAKLLKKGSVYSSTATQILRLAPMAGLAGLLGGVLLMPFGMNASPLAFTGDILLFIYLLGFSRISGVLAALDTGSSFEGMGASREMQFSALAEGAFLAVTGFLVILTGKFSLSETLNGFSFGAWSYSGTAMLLVTAAFFLVLLAESCRVPFDDPETHLELTMIHEAMILDYGGPDLAMILYGASLKLWLLASFLVLLILPCGMMATWLNTAVFFVSVGLIAVLIGIVESVMARFRFLKVPQFINAATALAVLAVIFMIIFGEGAQ